jgi:putative membrane protein
MKLIAKLIFSLAANGIALWIAAHAVQGFSIVPTVRAYLIVAAVFTVIELIIRPILKLLLAPIIIITLGLGLIVIDAIVLEVLAHTVGQYISITGLYPLVYATLIIGAVHVILSVSSKYIHD